MKPLKTYDDWLATFGAPKPKRRRKSGAMGIIVPSPMTEEEVQEYERIKAELLDLIEHSYPSLDRLRIVADKARDWLLPVNAA